MGIFSKIHAYVLIKTRREFIHLRRLLMQTRRLLEILEIGCFVTMNFYFYLLIFKELLIELINDLLEGEHHVEDLSYMDKENPSETTDGRGVIFDLLCKDWDGTIFIVELQNARQDYFYERALYYLCRMIASQGEKGESWKFKLVPVYGIFLLNFKSGETDKVRTDLVIADRETGEQKGRNFREIFIEFPLFNKTEAECKTPLDYWLYNLKHMEQLEHLSFKGQKALFNRLEELARIANMNKKIRSCPENIPG